MSSNCHISPYLTGGIGNQLFEIANAYSLSLDKNCNLIIYEPRGIGLGHIQNNINKKYDKLPKKICDIFPNIKCLVNNIIEYDTYIKEKRGYMYENIPLNMYIRKNENTKLIGVFSAYTYFSKYQNEVKKLFEFSSIINEITNKNFSKILKEPNTISLHFRRGDKYNKVITKKKLWCIPKIDYYYNAIDKFLHLVNNTNYLFVIFNEKEDDKWIQNDIIPYLIKNKLKYIHIEYNIPYIISLNLISKCKHNIISNSTFSFWGAFLNQNKNKYVFVPQVWKSFKNPYKLAMMLRGNILSSHTDERLPKEWIKIDTECIN